MVQIVSPETALSWLRKWNAGKRPPKEVPVRFRIVTRPDDTDELNKALADGRAMNLIERAPIYNRNATPQSSVSLNERQGQQARSSSTKVREAGGFLPGSLANDLDLSKDEFAQARRSWLQPSQPRPGIRGIDFPEDSVPRIDVAFSRPQLTTAPETGVQP